MNEGFAFCGACGARIESSARFCTSCGESQEPFMETGGGDEPVEAKTAILLSEADFAAEEETVAEAAPVALTVSTIPATPPAGRPLAELPPPAAPPASPTSVPAQMAPPKQDRVTAAVVAGYVFALAMPLVGAVIGGALHRGNRHGARIVVLSLAVMALFAAVAVAMLVVLGVEIANTSPY